MEYMCGIYCLRWCAPCNVDLKIEMQLMIWDLKINFVFFLFHLSAHTRSSGENHCRGPWESFNPVTNIPEPTLSDRYSAGTPCRLKLVDTVVSILRTPNALRMCTNYIWSYYSCKLHIYQDSTTTGRNGMKVDGKHILTKCKILNTAVNGLSSTMIQVYLKHLERAPKCSSMVIYIGRLLG